MQSNVKLFNYIAIALSVLLASCSLTRYVPEGERLLTKNTVKIQREKGVTKDKAYQAEELSKYIIQRPNKRLLGNQFYLRIYNLQDTAKFSWWSRMMRKIGQPPVVFDSLKMVNSTREISRYLNNCGFLQNSVSATTTTSNRKVKVKYEIKEGKPWRLGELSYIFSDKSLQSLVLADSANTLLHTGELFNIAMLDAERKRIAELLQNQGYYAFTINNISFLADSLNKEHTINIRTIVRQNQLGYDAKGFPIREMNRVYRIRNIEVNMDFDPTLAMTDSTYENRLDTTVFNGIKFLTSGSFNVRPDVFLKAINIYPGDVYDAEQVKKAYDNIMRFNYFKTAVFTFKDVTDSTNNQAGRGEIDFKINCTPRLKQGYKLEVEATTSSDYYGLLFTVGYTNRNLMKGIETLDLNLTGGYEIMRTSGRQNSYEFGISSLLTFPQLFLPFSKNYENSLSSPRTKLSLSANIQDRPYYQRLLAGAAMGYSWNSGKYWTFSVNPIDVSLIKLYSINPDFFNSLLNPYLKRSYESQLIAGLSSSFLMNNSKRGQFRNTTILRMNFETSGNLLNMLSNLLLTSQGDTEDPHYKFLGIRYAQYVRGEANFSYRIPLGAKTALVYRLFGGLGVAYGNSSSVPFERMFYCGGSNSMRGWQARTLGPGNSTIVRPEYPQQLGNVKLETNLELRFPIANIFHGAVFCDLGNVWLTGSGVTEESEFKWNNFYRQFGFNTGIGTRLDFGFFILRLDWGIKLYNPNELPDCRWIDSFRLKNTTLNFAVGYPF